MKLPSISLAESRGVALRIESAVREFPEVTGVISRTGRAEGGFDPEGSQITHTEIQLRPRDEWRYSTKAELVEAMAKRLETIPGAVLTFTQPIADMIDDLMSGAKAQIAVKIFGDDLGQLQELGDQIQRILSTIDGIV